MLNRFSDETDAASAANVLSFRARESAPALCTGETFRAAMSELASGVAILTLGDDEARVGLATTSVSTLSLEPPTLIACVHRASAFYDRLRPGLMFGVSVLGGQHADVADAFGNESGFHEGRWSAADAGVLWLDDALAAFACEVEGVIARHSHAILIGRVRVARPSPSGPALLAWRSAYERIGWSAEEIARASGQSPRLVG